MIVIKFHKIYRGVKFEIIKDSFDFVFWHPNEIYLESKYIGAEFTYKNIPVVHTLMNILIEFGQGLQSKGKRG